MSGVEQRILDWAARLLPGRHRDWGQAMQAELAQLESGRERRAFVAGCVTAVLRRPAALSNLRYPLVMVAILVVGIVWSGQIAYPPLRQAVLMMVLILVGLAWLGRWAGALGPVRDDRAARVIRAAGLVLVAVLAIGVIDHFSRATGGFDEKAGTGTPIYTTVFGLNLLAFLAITRGRSAADSRTLATGGRVAAGAWAVWLVSALLWPPLPVTSLYALATVAGGMAVAVYQATGTLAQRATAALTTGALASLLIFATVTAVLLRIPVWVPDIGGSAFPASVSAADRLEANRNYASDPYIAVLFIGAILAAALAMVSLAVRRRRTVLTR